MHEYKYYLGGRIVDHHDLILRLFRFQSRILLSSRSGAQQNSLAGVRTELFHLFAGAICSGNFIGDSKERSLTGKNRFCAGSRNKQGPMLSECTLYG